VRQRPEEIWDYYQSALAAFDLVRRHVRVPNAASDPSLSRWRFLTPLQVDDDLRSMRDELEFEVSLALLASFETILDEDFLLRPLGTDRFSHAISRLRQRTSDPRLEEVLDCWKERSPAAHAVIGEFKQLVKFRHWLAHGRGSAKKGYGNHSPGLIWRRARLLQKAVAGFPRLVPP